MSRSTDRAGPTRDRGFTLIEIIVALGVLSIVLVALLPQLVVGIRATGTARLVSQAKGVSSGQLERMRNLPYHIARDAGPYRDVLDTYFPDVDPPATPPTCSTAGTYTTPSEGWSGYVAPGGTRCDYEPTTGAFHRTVSLVGATSGMAGYALVVDTQFLSGTTPPAPVTPLTVYNTQTPGKDNPASSQIGVTVTVVYTQGAAPKPMTTYTQVAKRLTSKARIRSEADVRVLDVGSVTPDADPLTLSAGLLHLKGAVSFASTATADLTAVSGSLASGTQAAGATTSASAPPSSATVAPPTAAGTLGGDCRYSCWGESSATTSAVSSDDALPVVGSAATPARTSITDVTNNGLTFMDDRVAVYRPLLDLAPPLLRFDPSAPSAVNGPHVCSGGTTGTPPLLSASGYLTTTPPGASSLVEACAVARAAPIELFPTTFAPHGVVRIDLQRASVRCAVHGTAPPEATYDYQAVVQYWNGTAYSTAATIVPGQTGDALAAVPLTTSVGGPRTLGDYVASWSSLTVARVTRTETARVALLTLPGIVTIASQPVRLDAPASTLSDETSVVSATVGVLSCRAEDAR